MVEEGCDRRGWLGVCCAGLVFLLVAGTIASAQTELSYPDLGIPSLVAPAWFGPNAFPVPPMLDGATHDVLSAELSADAFVGYAGDLTLGPFARLRIPLFSNRATLSLWMTPFEWYRSTERRLDECRVADAKREAAMRGTTPGDVYVSTDVVLLTEGARRPGVAVRAAVKTASGYDFDLARTYDDPGYFFDLTVGKEFAIGGGGQTSLRVAASTGFLCWQTDRGRQDDAAQYGLLLRLHSGHLTTEATLAGYIGWEVGDKPMVASLKASWSVGEWQPYLLWQAGLHDWPFFQTRAGVVYNIDILKH